MMPPLKVTDTDCGILWPGVIVNPPRLIVCEAFDGSRFPLEDSDAAPNWKSVTAHPPIRQEACRKGKFNSLSIDAWDDGIKIIWRSQAKFYQATANFQCQIENGIGIRPRGFSQFSEADWNGIAVGPFPPFRLQCVRK
jgi:hypothetical protein